MTKRMKRFLLLLCTAIFTVFATAFAVSCNEDKNAGFALDKNNITVTVGAEAETLTVTKDGKTYLGPVNWLSDDSAIVKVVQGKVTGVREGESSVTAVVPYGDSEYKATCKVKVNASIEMDTDDMFVLSGSGDINVTLAEASGVSVSEVTASNTASGASVLVKKIGNTYFLANGATSPMAAGEYALTYTLVSTQGVTSQVSRKVFVRSVERYEDVMLLAPIDGNDEMVGLASNVNSVSVSTMENFGEFVTYGDEAIEVPQGLNQTREEFLTSLQQSGYDGYLKEGVSGYDTVYRSYTKKYNTTTLPRPYFYFNLYSTANPVWMALNELPDDAKISIWGRTWFKEDGTDEFVPKRSAWMYFYKNMNTGVTRIPAGESGATSYDPVGGWCNYKIPVSKIREAVAGCKNIAFSIQVDGTQRGEFYFELYSVEMQATKDLVAPSGTVNLTLPGGYSGYFDAYEWTIAPKSGSATTFTASGSNADDHLEEYSVPFGEYEVTYSLKRGGVGLDETVSVGLKSGVINEFSSSADVTLTGWSRSPAPTYWAESPVGTPTAADGYKGLLSKSSVLSVNTFNPAGRVIVSWEISDVTSRIDELGDSDYIGLWTYYESEVDYLEVLLCLSEGTAHGNNNEYTSSDIYLTAYKQVNGWFLLKITIADLKQAMATKPYATVTVNTTGKPSLDYIPIDYDTMCLDFRSKDETLGEKAYFFAAEFGHSFEDKTSYKLDGTDLTLTDEEKGEWDTASLAAGVKDALTNRTLTEGVDYDMDGTVFKPYKNGEYLVEYAIGKNGHSYGYAVRKIVFTKDLTADMGYGVVNDLTIAQDMHYIAANKWGASAVPDAAKANYGTIELLSTEEYEALRAAGYQGALDKKTVYRMSGITTTDIDHNGYRSGVFAGGYSFSKRLIDYIYNSEEDLTGAYLSVWVRANEKVNYRYSGLMAFKEETYGGVPPHHYGNSGQVNAVLPKAGYAQAGEWRELRFDLTAMRKSIEGLEAAKNLSFMFSVTTADDSEGATQGKTVALDVYSIEICYGKIEGTAFSDGVQTAVPTFGVKGFDYSVEVYDEAGNKLVLGSQYQLTNGLLSGLNKGEYLVEYTVTGSGIEAQTFYRTATFTTGYNVITEATKATDLFYHASKNWGASCVTSYGATYGGDPVDYGTTTELSTAEYAALVAAGYKGAKTSLTTWRATRDLNTELDGGNGYRTELYLGGANFNDALVDFLDSGADLSKAYISVWMKAGAKVSFRYSQVFPFKTGGGAYSGQHMGVQLDSTISVGNGYVEANTWVEHRWKISDLLAKIPQGSDMKGVGFGLSITTGEKDAAEATVPYVDIYSIEVCFDDVSDFTLAKTSASVAIPSLGAKNFSYDVEVYDATGKKLTQGTDYAYASDSVSGLPVGYYTLKYLLKAHGNIVGTLSRGYLYSNVLASSTADIYSGKSYNDAGVNDWNHGMNVRTVEGKYPTAKDGYKGVLTKKSAVAIDANTANAAGATQLAAVIDISAVTAQYAEMDENDYISVWIYFEMMNQDLVFGVDYTVKNFTGTFSLLSKNDISGCVVGQVQWRQTPLYEAFGGWKEFKITKENLAFMANGADVTSAKFINLYNYASAAQFRQTMYIYSAEYVDL